MSGKSRVGVKAYDAFLWKKTWIFIGLSLFMLLAGLVAIGLGSSWISIGEVVKTLVGMGEKESNAIIFGIRLPRVVTSILVGAALAVTGCVMQSVLRNPLASSSTLGVSQGASFGATVGIILFGAGAQNSTSAASAVSITNPYVVTLCAFLGGSISTVVILGLSRIRQIGPQGLILAGVALSSLFQGASTLIQYFADDTQVAAVVFWTFGDLGRTNWIEIAMIGICLLGAMIYFLCNRWNYNAMESGTATAKSLGVNVNAVMLISMAVCSMVAAVAVSFVGIISFVGLVAPHVMRRFVGNDYRFLIPASAAAGAVLLLLADTFGRLVVAPIILPIGAITSFLGAPVFLYLLFKGVSRK